MGACLFDRVTPNMKIYREEIFGPVLGIMRVKDLESAIQLINDHQYGNGTAIFTRDGHTARTFAERIQVGMVWCERSQCPCRLPITASAAEKFRVC